MASSQRKTESLANESFEKQKNHGFQQFRYSFMGHPQKDTAILLMRNIQRLSNLLKFSFAAAKQPRPKIPTRNGGTLCIPRDELTRYYECKLQETKDVKSLGLGLVPEVRAFQKAIEEDPILKMCFEGALNSLTEGEVLYGKTPEQVFELLSATCIEAPKFHNESITGVPFLALFGDFLDNRFGQAFFSNPITNVHIKKIFNAYQTMLMSSVSTKYMVETGIYAWFGEKALNFWNPDEYYVDKTKPHWGFSCWNDWFTRQVRPEARPIAPGKNVVIQSSDSYPLAYPPEANNQYGVNPTYDAKPENQFWLKDNKYSLYDMFGVHQMGTKHLVDSHFVGGTIYQAFLDPWCYHRWHSPVDGTIVKSYKLGGTYYLSNPGMPLGGITPDGIYIDSQPLLSIVSVRQVYIIRMDDDPQQRHVAVIEIGMAEVSSCHPTVIEGQQVKKGDQLGYFSFGGSSHVVIFDKAMDIKFKEGLFDIDPATGQGFKQNVNGELATILN